MRSGRLGDDRVFVGRWDDTLQAGDERGVATTPILVSRRLD